MLDGANPWHHRRRCARALFGKVPAERMMELVDLVCSDDDQVDVRISVLEVLTSAAGPHREALLEWLRGQSLAGDYASCRLDDAMLTARALLGDISVADSLVEMAADAWSHRSAPGVRALRGLIVMHGLPAVLGMESPRALMLSGRSQAVRLIGVGLSHETGFDIVPALADPSVSVARAAYDRLVPLRGPQRRVESLMASATTPGPAQLWALAVLSAHHPTEVRALWEALGPPSIALPDVPADVRAAILRQYAPGTPDTDPRWLIEAALLPPYEGPDGQELLGRAVSALDQAGLQPGQPLSAGDEHRQGAGTYHSIETLAGRVTVSTLGPFFLAHGDADRVKTALAEFRHIDNTLAETVFESLSVYHFGDREPLRVRELLFYWQD
ncbi:hypothetical protein ACFVVM_00040 [Nocardia sp. NPDC058176]|uniref:hypothetical protein n=1 Tax=Nocardia sp. NPDC058176 TaxID=3346368 RepID=UPI0036DCCD1C